MLMIRVNVQFQISNVFFVYGEIMQTHTMHECNFTVITR